MEGNARETLNGRRGPDEVGLRNKDEIQRHIQATQEELRHTLEAITESFSPGEMLDAVVHALRVGPGEFASSLGRSVRDNPVAVSMLGAGLAWLMLGTETRQKVRGRASDAGHQVRDKAGKVRSKAERAAGKVRAKAEGAADEAAGQGQSVADATRDKAEEARNAAQRGFDQAKRTASEQPLVVAAVGLVAGAAVAAMIPRSRVEERLFGERAEEAVEVAEDAARGLGEGVREGFEAHAESSSTPGAGAQGSSSDPTGVGEPE